MNNYLWIANHVKKYWNYALLNILFNLLAVVFNVVSLTLVIPFLGLLFGTQPLIEVKPTFDFSVTSITDNFYYILSQIIITEGRVQALMWICFLVVILFFLKNLFRYLGMYFVAPIRNGVVKDMRQEVYDKILVLPLSFFSEERKGDVIARTTNDLSEIEWTILSSIEAIFRDPFAIIFFLITLFYMSPELTVFVLVLLPLTGLIIGRIGRSLKKAAARGQQKMGLLISMIEETLSGLRIIQAFNAENYSKKKFSNTNQMFNLLMNKMYRKRDLASPLSEFLGAIVLVIVMYFGGRLVLGGTNELDPSVFIGFIAIFSQIINPAKSFAQAFYNVQKGVASAERVLEILNAKETIVEKANAVSKPSFDLALRYENVHFAYGTAPVLKGVNLDIRKGQMIALVGQSGAGKTTMADLLPRFYDPISGVIKIDGIPIADIKLADLRNLMGIVNQESILFNDTVFNNIAFGMPNVTEDEVVNAAKIANAHEFIDKLDKGYYTNIGDRGGKLSGGQRQRLSIARAVLKNPPVLILDEATSALDSESERLVQDAIQNLMKNRTSLVIAHRLSTVQHANCIVVMHEGEIAEMGTHDELLSMNGVYKNLYQKQYFS